MRDILAMHADEVFSLENRKFQLKMSMDERREEITVHRDGLRTELKLLREDVHRITLELKERMLRVEKLQNKYETISSKTRGSEGSDEEPKSQAYYVIKAAQEREELQREGDALDAKIRKAEREVTALEATMMQLLVANGNYGSSFKKVDSQASINERAALRDKLDKTYDKLKFKRQEEASLVMDLQQVESRLLNLSAEQVCHRHSSRGVLLTLPSHQSPSPPLSGPSRPRSRTWPGGGRRPPVCRRSNRTSLGARSGRSPSCRAGRERTRRSARRRTWQR